MTTTVIELDPRRPLRLEVQGVMPCRDPAIEAAWRKACHDNPRLFDGSILSVQSVDASSNLIRAKPDRFAHVVCDREAPTLPTTILSVTGIIEADDQGRACVLLARRGAATRSYPGMWEFAPAGGLHPTQSPRTLGLAHVLDTLRAELLEEVGVEDQLEHARATAVVADPDAKSMDIIVRAQLSGVAPILRIQGDHAWECSEARWVPIAHVPSFMRAAPGGVIQPTLAMAHYLGWV